MTERRRRTLIFSGAVAALLLLAAAIAERHLKATIEHAMSVRTGRPVRIGGDLTVHLLSMHPRVSALQVSVGNPPWSPAGEAAEAERVTLLLEWHWGLPPLQIRRLEIVGANLHLVRDARGRANWQMYEEGPGHGPPLIHSLSMPDARVELHDARRHLEFNGTVSAADEADDGAAPLLIEGAGQLNGRAASFWVRGDPLAGVRRNQPYHFSLEEHSGAMRLRGQGEVETPFDLGRLHGSFDVRGPDMAEVYYLVGLKMPPTAPFELSGELVRSGMRFEYNHLRAHAGESDVEGNVSVDVVGGHVHTEAQLNSKHLRNADVGSRAAAPPPVPADGRQVLRLSDAPLQVTGIKHGNAAVRFHVGQLDLGRIALNDATGKVVIENGVLSVTGLQAGLAGGALTGTASLDASHTVLHGSLDLALAGVQLSQVKRDPAALGSLSGLLSVRAQLSGSGASLRALAETADGTVTAVIPQGTVRAALAEAASLELAGALGLMTKSQKPTDVRCAVASFGAHEGVVSARTVVFDTDKALITMTGEAQIDTEALDFTLRGHPKTATLALHSAVAVRGTLAHPQFRLAGERAAGQTGVAAALGLTLTPLAALLAFVNPGLAHDADCEALLASVAPAVPAAPPPH